MSRFQLDSVSLLLLFSCSSLPLRGVHEPQRVVLNEDFWQMVSPVGMTPCSEPSTDPFVFFLLCHRTENTAIGWNMLKICYVRDEITQLSVLLWNFYTIEQRTFFFTGKYIYRKYILGFAGYFKDRSGAQVLRPVFLRSIKVELAKLVFYLAN